MTRHKINILYQVTMLEKHIVQINSKKIVKLLLQGVLQTRLYSTTVCVVNYHLTCRASQLKNHHGKLLVAVDLNQLRSMASKIVDPTDPPLYTPILYRVVTPERDLHSTNRCSLCRESNSQPFVYEATAMHCTAIRQ